MGIDVSWKGWAALATFALQNGLAILLVRYSKLHDKPYSSQVVVLLQEGAVKLPTSMLMYAWECGGGLRACRSLADDLRQRPVEWLQLSVPALLYTVQNTMLYVGFANVEAAVGQVTSVSQSVMTKLLPVEHMVQLYTRTAAGDVPEQDHLDGALQRAHPRQAPLAQPVAQPPPPPRRRALRAGWGWG